MSRKPTSPIRAGAAALAGLMLLGAPMAQAQPAPGPPQPAYHPSLGDLMTMAVQPRHTKLGLAGKARDWDYAAYEASELRNAFNRIARTVPLYRKADLGEVFAANVKEPLDAIDAAIKAKNGPGLDTGYAKLTASCNTCHKTLDHGYVVIRAPLASSFPDQAFAPSKGAGR